MEFGTFSASDTRDIPTPTTVLEDARAEKQWPANSILGCLWASGMLTLYGLFLEPLTLMLRRGSLGEENRSEMKSPAGAEKAATVSSLVIDGRGLKEI